MTVLKRFLQSHGRKKQGNDTRRATDCKLSTSVGVIARFRTSAGAGAGGCRRGAGGMGSSSGWATVSISLVCMIFWGWKAYAAAVDAREATPEAPGGLTKKFVWTQPCWHVEKAALSASVPLPWGQLRMQSLVALTICSVGLFVVLAVGEGEGREGQTLGCPSTQMCTSSRHCRPLRIPPARTG